MHSIAAASSTDVAWLAGLLEGEGSFYVYVGVRRLRPTISISMTDRDVVERATHLMGTGLYVLARREPHHKQPYMTSATGDRAVMVMKAVLPYMGERRSARIEAAISAWESRTPRRIVPIAEARERRAAGQPVGKIAADLGFSKRAIFRALSGR